MGKRAINSNDVARLAQVSQATVSAVINNTRFVTAETRTRVEQAIAELGYRPNALARSLKMQTSRVIGLVLPTLLSPWTSDVVGMIDRAAEAHGYTIMLAQTDNDPDRETRLIRTLLDQQVAGFIAVPSYEPNAETVQLLTTDIPTVLLGRRLPGVDVDRIGFDDQTGAQRVVEHLIAHGRRRIGMLLQPLRTIANNVRLQSFRDTLRAAHLPDMMFIEAGVERADGEAATRELLARYPDLDALYTGSHLLTIGALAALEHLGRRVPDDIALIGHDNLPWTDQLRVPLSLVHQPHAHYSIQAVELLLRRLADPTAPVHEVLLPQELILRRSCGCPWPP